MPDVTLPHPPMGWNSWDVYGASVTEGEALENAIGLIARDVADYFTYRQ